MSCNSMGCCMKVDGYLTTPNGVATKLYTYAKLSDRQDYKHNQTNEGHGETLPSITRQIHLLRLPTLSVTCINVRFTDINHSTNMSEFSDLNHQHKVGAATQIRHCKQVCKPETTAQANHGIMKYLCCKPSALFTYCRILLK